MTARNEGQQVRRAIPPWVAQAAILWERRGFLVRVAVGSLLLGLATAFAIPKSYKSTARIMPPGNAGMGPAMIAALAGHALGGMSGLGGLAGSFLGMNNTTALFADLLRSGTVADHLIERFELQRVYGKRYRVDTAKRLARCTTISDDKRSGVITIAVEDRDPRRARDLAQGYLDELNLLVNRTSTSSAHQERVFVERRLEGVQADLQRAQERLSAFSSEHSTIDMKEQARAMVGAAAGLQAQAIVEESNLNSLRQVYGDGNVRLRAAQARLSVLRQQLAKLGGSSAPLGQTGSEDATGSELRGQQRELYPPLRQLPRLAVPFANLYREVQVQEAVFQLLTEQYEIARIQEAKDVPVIGVIDRPGIPEKKSFPPRILLAVGVCALSTVGAGLLVLLQQRWQMVDSADPRKELVNRILRGRSSAWRTEHSGEAV